MQTMGKLRPQFHDHEQSRGQAAAAMSRVKKNPIKVTYISSPMKVKVSSASEFRAIVQELTGKNSDDSYTATVNLPAHDEEANHVGVAAAAADDDNDQLIKNVAAHEYLLDDAFCSHLCSSLELDERFLMWRSDVSSDSSFGFQSPFLSLYR